MTKLYKKSEILFAVVFIAAYVAGTSIADSLSQTCGMEKSVTLAYHLLMSAVILIWIEKNGYAEKYGLCRSRVPASGFLYYVPLVILSSVNLWFGVRMNMPVCETVLYVLSMIFVGFLEEIIFRGFLFRAMAKDGITSAVIVSSVTFGIGHIVNLFNGSGATVFGNLCQIAYAVAFGFMFVMIFRRGGSLFPCIISHSTINSLSAFANESAITDTVNIVLSAVLCIASIGYTAVICKLIPERTGNVDKVNAL